MKMAAMTLAASTVMVSCNVLDTPERNERKDIPLTKAEEEINSSVNDFAFKVFDALYEDDQVLISPLSLSLALSTAAIGAEGDTEKQMLETLGFAGCDTEAMNTYYEKMVNNLVGIDHKTTLDIANSIWADKTLKVKKDFIDNARKYYDSEVRTVDFESPEALKAINKWCSQKTSGKIDKIADKLPPDMALALVNALYFKGKWSFEFDNATVCEDFTTIDGSKVKADMMKTTKDLLYSEEEGYRLVQLPYGNGAFVMDVILPDEGVDFEEAVKAFDAGTLDLLVSTGDTREVSLKMPEFKFDYFSELKDILPALGMVDAFNPFMSNFNGIYEKDENGLPLTLYINTVMHKTYIDVNTKGTEAAAITFVGFGKCMSPGPSPHVDFIVDRPFIFLIREVSTGAILFLGQKVS